MTGRLRILAGRAWRTSLPVKLAALAALLALAAAALVGREDAPAPTVADEDVAVAVADAVPYDGRSPRADAGGSQRVLVELPRPSLGRRGPLSPRDQRKYVRSLRMEGEALRSGLEAQGLRFEDVVTFERTWNGFAATVRARDIARLGEKGLRSAPVRRFFPALSEPVPGRPCRAAPSTRGKGAEPLEPCPSAPAPEGATVAVLAGGIAGAKGYDAVERDDRPEPGPDPRDPARSERSGELLGAIVAAPVQAIRVSAIRLAEGVGAEEFALTDELMTGLERTVDPDGDGDTEDRVPVALIGVSAPYAGFSRAPEAAAVRAAVRLGTFVAAPAGQEGAASGPLGTIGSPGGSPAAVTVGAFGVAPARSGLTAGEEFLGFAALLAGAPAPGGDLRTGPGEGNAAVVEPKPTPLTAVAKAVAAGAKLVVLAERRDDRALASLPAGAITVPVLGLTGPAARSALAVPAGTRIVVARPSDTRVGTSTKRLAAASSRGPTLDGIVKPDAVRPGGVMTADGQLVAGSAVAAAVVAAEAADLLKAFPRLAPANARRRLVGARTSATDVGRPPRLPVGRLELTRERGRVTGVRFTVGAFERGDPLGATGTRIEPAASVELTVRTAAGAPVRRLTAPGGALELLPGEYAYSLPAAELRSLPAGSYVFRVVARAPGQGRPTRRTSPAFRR